MEESIFTVKLLCQEIIRYTEAKASVIEIAELEDMKALLAQLVGGLIVISPMLEYFYQGSEVTANYYLSATALMALSHVGGMRDNMVYRNFCEDFGKVLESRCVPEVWQAGFRKVCLCVPG